MSNILFHFSHFTLEKKGLRLIVEFFFFSECFYADETQLVGDGNALNPKPINVGNTADCIESCINTWGCRYWTVSKSPNLATGSVECHLKSWKGRREQAQGFISGSLPSACCKFGRRRCCCFFD